MNSDWINDIVEAARFFDARGFYREADALFESPSSRIAAADVPTVQFHNNAPIKPARPLQPAMPTMTGYSPYSPAQAAPQPIVPPPAPVSQAKPATPISYPNSATLKTRDYDAAGRPTTLNLARPSRAVWDNAINSYIGIYSHKGSDFSTFNKREMLTHLTAKNTPRPGTNHWFAGPRHSKEFLKALSARWDQIMAARQSRK